MKKFSLLLLLFFSFCFCLHAQEIPVGNPQDSIYIRQALRLSVTNINNNVLQTLAGGVKVRQGTTIFSCDSCVVNSDAHTFEAFGHVFIDDGDTSKVWSDHLRYLTDKKLAYLDGNVKLSDGKATLTTNTLEYDVASKIGTYKNGGRVVNKKSVLTSREGIYYADIRDFYFKHNVELKDPAYTLKSDSLLYNTETQIARFIATTFIKDSSGRTIKTKEGYYDSKAGHAEFTQRTTIQEKTTVLSGDEMKIDDSTGIIQARGNAVLHDSAKGMDILAGDIFMNRKTEALLATKKPLMIIKEKNDSFFVAADTIFSARLSDLHRDTSKVMTFKGKKDSAATKGKTDSTDRYMEAYRNVRVYSDSMQSVSDSLFYSFKDSIFRLYQNPVVWSKKSQITGDTILLYTKNRKADRIKVFNNSFMASEVRSGVYNQIQSSRMDGYFKNGTIDVVNSKGLAESIYFIQDKDSAFASVNQTTSDAIDIYFQKGELYKVVLRSDVKGDDTPIKHVNPADLHLKNFLWLDDKRPKSKYELYQ